MSQYFSMCWEWSRKKLLGGKTEGASPIWTPGNKFTYYIVNPEKLDLQLHNLNSRTAYLVLFKIKGCANITFSIILHPLPPNNNSINISSNINCHRIHLIEFWAWKIYASQNYFFAIMAPNLLVSKVPPL